MPVIHASLSDEDFVDFAIMARKKGMNRSALASYLLIAEIRKDVKHLEEEEKVKFNSQGLPLAKKLKQMKPISADGTPTIPLYERGD